MFSGLLDQSTREDPLFLKGISKTDFVAFLKLICRRLVYESNRHHRYLYFGHRNLFQREELSSEDWASVLKLSILWGFDEARAQAIEKLAPTTAAVDPTQIIRLAKTHNVHQWYSSQTTRRASISFDGRRGQSLRAGVGLEGSADAREGGGVQDRGIAVQSGRPFDDNRVHV